MRRSLGRGLVFFGMALIVATAIRAVADMLHAEPFDPWVVVFSAGCVLASVGWGLWRRP